MGIGEFAEEVGGSISEKGILGILLFISLLLIIANHFFGLGAIGILAWAIFIICFVIWIFAELIKMERGEEI